MRNRIESLERVAKQLEPNAKARQKLRAEVIAHTESYLEGVYDRPAFVETESQGMGIYQSPIMEEAMPFPEMLSLIKSEVDHPGLRPASPGHLGYIPGGGLYPSALGDYMADIGNHYAGILFASPGAVRVENMLVRWMCDIFGYGKGSGGNLTSGGSIANLMGVVTARDAAKIKAKDFERLVLYMSEQTHHCAHKAIRIAGLGEAHIRNVPLDERFRMSVEGLAQMVEQDKAQGLIPFMLIASVGTTDTGAVDPLPELHAITQKHNIWLHVDAAYGGFFVLCPEGQEQIRGIELADSIVVDPHKGLFLPYGTGAFLIKKVELLHQSHYYKANYMQDTQQLADELSPADLSPELTKHFRGLRLWVPLKLFGLKPFRAALSEKIWLTRYFYEEIQKIEGMEVGPFPDLSVMIFRYVPQKGNPNDFNQKLVWAIHKDGRVFLSSTMIDGIFYIRLAVLCFRTHLVTIEKCLEMIRICLSSIA